MELRGPHSPDVSVPDSKKLRVAEHANRGEILADVARHKRK